MKQNDTTVTSSARVQQTKWPQRYSIFGVDVSATDYAEATTCILTAAKNHESSCIDAMPVHGLITAVQDKEFGAAIQNFDMVCPDGQPVRWALGKFHKKKLADRVYGPTLTLHVLEQAEIEGLAVYFYGSTQQVLDALREKLLQKFPKLNIAAMESPPFRKLISEEEEVVVDRINCSGAAILLIGLGCPKQEIFAARNKNRIRMPMLCVGAAFDFHAGLLRQAPVWMQKRGLEWLFRLCMEPGRLWKRYVVTNSLFLYLCLKQIILKH